VCWFVGFLLVGGGGCVVDVSRFVGEVYFGCVEFVVVRCVLAEWDEF
jgi:hypothetical protein